MYIAEHAEDDPNSVSSAVQARLFTYAEALEPWAMSVARIMCERAQKADYETWCKTGEALSQSTKAILKSSIGTTYAQLQAEQVHLIKTLPREAALKVHEWATEGLYSGERYNELWKDVKDKLGSQTKVRAVRIARTETARARTNFTQARARALGSPGYIWHTVGDGSVRDLHANLEGTFHSWDDPPVTGMNKGAPVRSHPGCIYNCRCWAEPLYPEDLKNGI